MTDAERERYLALPTKLRATFLEYRDGCWTLPDASYDLFSVVDLIAQALIEHRLAAWLGKGTVLTIANNPSYSESWTVKAECHPGPCFANGPTRLSALLGCVEKVLDERN